MRTFKTWLGSLLLPLLTACTGQQTERTVVYENTVYQWRIEHVVEHNFPASTHQFYQVYLQGRPLVLPAKAFNDRRDIDRFLTAGGFDIADWRNKSVIVAFENIQEREGQTLHLIRSVLITPEFTEGEVALTDLYTQQTVVVTRVEPAASAEK